MSFRRRGGIKESLGCLLLFSAVSHGHHFFGIRLLILAAGGLAGMYLLHNLATDFDKLTKPIRPTLPLQLFMRPLTTLMKASRGKREAVLMSNETSEVSDTNSIDFKVRVVLENDPLGCVKKYICHISTRPITTLNKIDKNVLRILRSSRKLKKLLLTDDKKTEKGNKDCFSPFPLCFFTGSQLETFMSLF